MGWVMVRRSTMLDSGGFQKPHLETLDEPKLETRMAPQVGVGVPIVESVALPSASMVPEGTYIAREGLEARRVPASDIYRPLRLDRKTKYQYALPTSSTGNRRNLPRPRPPGRVVRHQSIR